MSERIPTSVLTILDASQVEGEKLTTLKCRMTGVVKPFSKGVIFPLEKELQIKEIFKESDNTYMVKVKGIAFKNCKKYSIITPVDLQVRYGKRAYFMPSDFHSKEFFSGEYNITGGVFNGYRIFNRERNSAKVTRVGNLYSVDFPFRAPLVPGAEYYFESKTGFKGEMQLIYPGVLSKKGINIINSRVEKFRSRPGIKGIYSIILRTDGFVKLPFFLENEEFDGSVKLGNGRAMSRELESYKSKIIKQSKASGGVLKGDIKKKLEVDDIFFKAIIKSLIEDNLVFSFENYIVYSGDERANYLSPLAKEGYKEIVDAGKKGVSLRAIKNPGLKRCFDEIRRMRLAQVLDGDLFINMESYNELLLDLFKGRNPGDKLSIQEVREVTGLSRRYIISLFEILEEAEIIGREIDEKRVIKKIL